MTNFHNLRGTGLTMAASDGRATTAETMHLTGHSSPTIAMRYQHTTMDQDKAIADRMGVAHRAAIATTEDLPNVASIGDA